MLNSHLISKPSDFTVQMFDLFENYTLLVWLNGTFLDSHAGLYPGVYLGPARWIPMQKLCLHIQQIL